MKLDKFSKCQPHFDHPGIATAANPAVPSVGSRIAEFGSQTVNIIRPEPLQLPLRAKRQGDFGMAHQERKPCAFHGLGLDNG